MKNFYRVLRLLAVAILCALVIVPAIAYVALSLTSVQNRIAETCEQQLSQLLGCHVDIGEVGIAPFNRVTLRNVVIETSPGDTALVARRLGAGIHLTSLLHQPIAISHVELIGADIRLYRVTDNSKLNIQPIINALQPKNKDNKPKDFDFQINAVLLRSSRFSYDVIDAPQKETFNPKHIEVSNLNADIRLPRLQNNDFTANIKRLNFCERSGFCLKKLSAYAHLSNEVLSVSRLSIALPESNLKFNDINLTLNGINSIGSALRSEQTRVALDPDSYLAPADLAAFVPQLSNLNGLIKFPKFQAKGNLERGSIAINTVYNDNQLRILLEGDYKNPSADNRKIALTQLDFITSGNNLTSLLSNFVNIKPTATTQIEQLGKIDFCGSASLTGSKANGTFTLSAAPGEVNFNLNGAIASAKNFQLSLDMLTAGAVNLATISNNGEIGDIEAELKANVTRKANKWAGDGNLLVDRLVFREHEYTNLQAVASLENEMLTGSANIDNDDICLNLNGGWSLAKHHKRAILLGDVTRFNPSALALWNKYPGAEFSGKVEMDFEGEKLHDMIGNFALTNVKFIPKEGQGIELNKLALNADEEGITLKSDYIDGTLRGSYSFPYVAAACTDILSRSFPALVGDKVLHLKKPDANARTNDFTVNLTVKETEKIADFFRLPVSVVYPVKIKAEVSERTQDLALTIDAPYIRQGNKLIEDTRLAAYVSGSDGTAGVDMTITAPTKNGPLGVMLQAAGQKDYFRTDVEWKINRAKAYNGRIAALTTFMRDDDGNLESNVNVLPGSLTFNDSTWIVNPAKIAINGGGKDIRVDGVNVHRSNQFVRINGRVGSDEASMLTLNLRNFSLDYLFESLGIDKVMLGGDASGTFYASRLLSKEPVLETPGLKVDNISYNKVVLGDANVRSHWDADNSAITLDAVIDQEEARRSFVNGAIYPLNDSLDITFNVNHAKVGFMQPYMEAFASDISGYASGRARIWGNFKYIDLEGDVFAEDLKLKINFTNTYYTATDSVHFRPGLIDLNGITIRDIEGHPAKLNGWVRHTFFKEPRFEFGITDANDFLSYNETPRENPIWYGKVYGNGSAFVKGEPGRIDINVDMATAPRSTFTFVLSDQEVADEYSFLTFRNKAKLSGELTDTIVVRDTSMDLVNRLKAMADSHGVDEPSDYNISLQMRVNPQAQIVLVMDPVGGDRIRAYGNGHLRMDYGSANNDLKMYGTYTLDRGDYNFTLQDVIIKDFLIKSNSTIAFNGDPYGAQLNIQAVYALNANLSDLDESFLQDKDLNRTNVPVHALMKVNGDIRQPEITFDLEFPTLTSDIYRKVRSIISTDDMMNRQIIYLLALNRFYTPEYMASTTKGNELVSVASSTISSQLSNLLGQISDNWNIAPTFRSDKGDFSDVEVDVALSSRLLNNRLLFNGNFGYRDNRLNSNQFIGDFDLEYILDREGMWRLKAYNRYNDQNYYLRTAHTTQGVGVVLKRDFDNFFSFLRKFRKKKNTEVKPTEKTIVAPADSTAETPAEPIQPATDTKAGVLPVPKPSKQK